MRKISALTIIAVLMALPAFASDLTRSRQEMRNLDSATKMHGLLESDHGRIYGWGQRDNYKDVPKETSDDTEKPPQEQRPSPVHRFHPHVDESGE